LGALRAGRVSRVLRPRRKGGAQLTLRLSMALMHPRRADEYCEGMEGSRPERTIVMSSVCVVAVENGELCVSS
jgi:hypothetical protein